MVFSRIKGTLEREPRGLDRAARRFLVEDRVGARPHTAEALRPIDHKELAAAAYRARDLRKRGVAIFDLEQCVHEYAGIESAVTDLYTTRCLKITPKRLKICESFFTFERTELVDHAALDVTREHAPAGPHRTRKRPSKVSCSGTKISDLIPVTQVKVRDDDVWLYKAALADNCHIQIIIPSAAEAALTIRGLRLFCKIHDRGDRIAGAHLHDAHALCLASE